MTVEITKVEDYKKEKNEKFICIQIQPDKEADVLEDDFLNYHKLSDYKIAIYREEKDDSYFNLNFYSDNLSELWKELRSVLFESAEYGEWLKNVSLVVCEGEDEWNDYRLLWNFNDENVDLDEI